MALTVHVDRYAMRDALALTLRAPNGDDVARVTVYPPRGEPLDPDEVLLRAWSEPATTDLVRAMVASGTVASPHRHVMMGATSVPVCRFLGRIPLPDEADAV